MPYEGQTGTAPDGTKVVFRGGKVYPIAQDPKANPNAAKVAPQDEKILGSLAAEAVQRQHLASRAQQFMQVQGTGKNAVATGPAYGDITLPLVGNINPVEGIAKIFNPRLNQLDSINNQTWPELRPIGSGPMRNTEVGGFKTAFPSTANWGEQNQQIAKRFQDEAAEATRKAQFVSQFVRSGKGSASDALLVYAPNDRATVNAALKAKSASAPAMTIDINGNPIK